MAFTIERRGGRCRGGIVEAGLETMRASRQVFAMKTQAKAVVAKKPQRKARVKHAAVKAQSKLPAWVVGCYDGPSDGKLSAKKAYAQ